MTPLNKLNQILFDLCLNNQNILNKMNLPWCKNNRFSENKFYIMQFYYTAKIKVLKFQC